jgi:hypothetical protein
MSVKTTDWVKWLLRKTYTIHDSHIDESNLDQLDVEMQDCV